MDVPIRPGDALAQPTRAALFALLCELHRPASTEELAAQLDLHPNGVRLHLERLRAAGLLTRELERNGPGRPRDAWAVSPDAQPGGRAPTGYSELARWLVRSLAAGRARVGDVEAVGRDIGRELAVPLDAALAAERRMYGLLASLGFQPAREAGDGDRLTYRLCNCPYRDAVRERQPLVCGLHRGLTRGVLDVLDPATRMTGFVAEDPDAAGCRIELRGPMARQAPSAPSGG